MTRNLSVILKAVAKLSLHKKLILQIVVWFISGLVCVLAVTAWGHDNAWQFRHLSLYQIFPVLGLLAFSLMLSHYVASVLRQLLKIDGSVLKRYFDSTSLLVLLLICLHPSLLIYQRYRDGYGLPPHSYESYVAPGLGWVTLLGTASLALFIAYEFRRIYGKKLWWPYVQIATDVAMLAIFYHALRLGNQLQAGWFRSVWWVYGIILATSLVYIYTKKYYLKDSASKH